MAIWQKFGKIANLTINETLDTQGVGNKIYVSTLGSDSTGIGAIGSPVATLTKAFTLVSASRTEVVMDAGEYDEAAAVVWPSVSGVTVTGSGGSVVISSSASISHVIGINPAAATGTWSATLNNVEIDHGDTYIGIQVNNTSVGKRINLYLKDVTGSGEGTFLDIDRAGAAGDAIRLYVDGRGHTFEGLVTVVTENVEDRFRFKGYRLIGGLTVVGAVACEVALISCGVKASGLTVDGANKLTNIHSWYETDANPNIYTAFTDAYATA